MKIYFFIFAILAIKVFGDNCKEGEKQKLTKGLYMKCKEGEWVKIEKRSGPGGTSCTDDPSKSCSADQGYCNQYTVKGAEKDLDCPGTCESCDGCRCQDDSQWHKYCPFWKQYCNSAGVLGNWMTTNCRKTCGECKCKCCSYQGKQHKLGATIQLPEKCGQLICEESMFAGSSPLLPGATAHNVSHPEELTLNFYSVHGGADCCILPGTARSADGSSLANGTMVAEGWSGELSIRRGRFSATCCHGVLSVPLGDASALTTPTTTPKWETLPQCKIESLSFALDISGSMKGASMAIWKPVAAGLVDEMARRQVNIDRHYLFTYVDTIQSSLTTQNTQEFKDKINNWSSFTGSRELTFAALKHAMEEVNSNAFVCVWTDEIGDDTNNATLKTEILNLKASTNSEIFFMVVTKQIAGSGSGSKYGFGSKLVRKAEDAEDKENNDEDDKPNKNRASLTVGAFEAKFNDIGHVMDITNDPNAITKMINIMKQTAICNEKSTFSVK